MAHISSKSGLAIALSKLSVFENAKVRVEQYPTDSEIAAAVLWDAYMKGEIEGKVIADLGSGTGILGIGALLLGASKVYFVENDPSAMDIAKKNIKKVQSEGLGLGESIIVQSDISEFDESVDIVVMNPPFGTKEAHADREFVEKATEISDSVYSFHKASTRNFIEKMAESLGFSVTEYTEFDFPLKASMAHHRKRIERIRVGLFRLKKQ